MWIYIVSLLILLIVCKFTGFYSLQFESNSNDRVIEPFYEFRHADNLTIPEMFALSEQHMSQAFNCNHIDTPKIGSVGPKCR